MARQEDFLFAERALQRGWVTDEQIQECLSLVDRLREEMKIDETLPALLVKKGYLAPAQANVLDAEIGKDRADRPKNAIEGYRLLARIGAGAMGSVYKADHLKLMVPVALKVLNPSLSSSRTQIGRLKREAQLAARLSHVNVVRSLDVGESNGFHYLAMEFVEGDTVRDRIAEGPMPEAEALGIIRQVAAGLAHAHAHGVVHRDVKPGNIMLTPDGTAKLGDFGLARGQGPSDLTLEHASIGTPQYVAPEQMRRGSDATTRSDLFSLGSTLYHMVTGRPPFDGENLGEIVQNVLACRFAPPESLAPDLSRDTIFVIDRLMRANPRERYASADELVADLDQIARGEPIAPPDFRGDYHAFLAKRRGKRNTILAACAIVLVAAGVIVFLREQSRTRREKLAEVCRVADTTRADAGALGSAKDLAAAGAEMANARDEARSAGCADTAIAGLSARLQATKAAKDALASAERIGKGSGDRDRNFKDLDADLEGLERDLDPAFQGARAKIAEIRRALQEESDAAAKSRYDRQVLDGFRDIDTATREAQAFAADLEDRYLPVTAGWVGNVAQAPRMLEDLKPRWQDVLDARERFDDEMRKEEPSYRFAASEAAALREKENAALDPVAANPYLARLTVLRDADVRALSIGPRERDEWKQVLAEVNALRESEPHRAEEAVRKFRDRASSELSAVEAKLREVGAELREAREKQLQLFEAEEQEYRTRLQNRLYMSAYEHVAEAAASRRWVPDVEERFRDLRDRAQRMTELTTRFAERVGKSSDKIHIKGEPFARDRVEPAPGDNKDLFLARGPKRTVEFTLGDLDRGELETILAFGPADKFRQGWFYAAEAYGADLVDPKEAKKLRDDAFGLLPGTDPWAPSVSAALEATRQRILKGEARAQQAEAELRDARAKNDPVRALALVNELVESLKWTDYCKGRLPDFQRQRNELEQLAGRGLFLRQMGVPSAQLDFGGRDVQGLPAKPTSVTFRGGVWYYHDDPKIVPLDEPDRVARLDQLARAYWADAFQGRNDIAVLVDRAMHQLLPWSGPVEVAPDGGYRPTPEALVDSPARWWKDRNAAAEAPEPPDDERPKALELTNPFRPDRPWSIELEVEWPGDPGYFVVAAGQIQGVLGYQRAPTRGGISGACILVGEDLDPAANAKSLFDLLPKEGGSSRRPKEGEKVYFGEGTLVPGVPYRMRLERVDDTIRFQLWPVGQADKRILCEKKDRRGAQLEKDLALAQGQRVFRFYGAPGYGQGYVLREVKITGILPERGEAKQ